MDEKWGPSVNLGHFFFNIQELISLGKLSLLNLMFVPIKADYATEWAPVTLLGNSCPAFEDTHLPGRSRVVGNYLGCLGSNRTRIYFPIFLEPGRQKLKWPAMKLPRAARSRLRSPWGWRNPGVCLLSLCPHLWETWSRLNDQWCPPCWLYVYTSSGQVSPSC